MKLSKDAIKMLRWMRHQDCWAYIEDLQEYKNYEYRTFAALKGADLVDATVFEHDYENPEYDELGNECYRESYRINDKGKAYLEDLPKHWLPEFREWIAVGISLIALIISIIALTLK